MTITVINITKPHCETGFGMARPAPIMYNKEDCKECSFALVCFYHMGLLKRVQELEGRTKEE